MFANKLKLHPDLGVVFDSNFTFSNHVSQVIKSSRVQARDLYRIRPLLDLNTSVLLANALTQGQPVYLRGLIHPYTSFRNTRRSTPKLKFLQTPTFDRRVHKSIKHFSNSFSHYAPALWNSFPFHVRNSPSVASFTKHLKTHLFSSSFPT